MHQSRTQRISVKNILKIFAIILIAILGVVVEIFSLLFVYALFHLGPSLAGIKLDMLDLLPRFILWFLPAGTIATAISLISGFLADLLIRQSPLRTYIKRFAVLYFLIAMLTALYLLRLIQTWGN